MTSRAAIDRVVARLSAGEPLRMELVDGARQWWFESPLEYYDDDTVRRAQSSIAVVECGDSLFGFKMNSQTWQAAVKA